MHDVSRIANAIDFDDNENNNYDSITFYKLSAKALLRSLD